MSVTHRLITPALGSLILAAVLALSACNADSAGPAVVHSPEDARLVFEDITRFWNAFDNITSSVDTLPLRREYLDRGTIGLRDFTELRWRNSRTLTNMVWPRREYYESIRANTLAITALEPEIRASYRKLAQLYSGAVFPDVYFVIGGMSTGGTTSSHGLLIGTELYTRAAESPLDELSPWQRIVIRSSEVLPAIVAHELIHFQQHYGSAYSLLAQSLREGSADFLGEMLSGKTINDHMVSYARTHEAEIWEEFQRAMNGTDVSRWLYNGGTVTSPNDRPADLGYFVGAEIARAYYVRATDKTQAIRDMLNISDFAGFLERSGYAERFR